MTPDTQKSLIGLMIIIIIVIIVIILVFAFSSCSDCSDCSEPSNCSGTSGCSGSSNASGSSCWSSSADGGCEDKSCDLPKKCKSWKTPNCKLPERSSSFECSPNHCGKSN